MITLEEVLKAYEYAESHPHRYLRGTTNWCAAVAWYLNKSVEDEIKTLKQEWADEVAEHRITQVNRDRWRSNYHAAMQSGIKTHDGQKLLVQHILDTDSGLSENSRKILEELIK